ncbi:TRAP transporter small permease [uncultured Pseudacidovorax sp.]|uniref:TRAP transporter small permease n=1 Tax=uncultured Pseudacidovorax sp. TaxID=679313 RepID=UPI0025F06D24|nr:TRAP transporter small permease [uncultured Pseudacidovorax sp.]
MNRWIDRACRAVENLVALMLAVMVVLVFGNVVLRYGFNSGILLSEEVSRWLFIWMTFLGALVALHERAHLGVDMVVGRLPPAGKKLCLLLSQLLMLYMLWLLLQGSIAQTRINWDVEAPVTGLSMAIVYSVGIVFAIGGGLLLLIDLGRLLTGRLRDDELVAVQESEEAAALAQVLGQAQASQADRNPHSSEGRP